LGGHDGIDGVCSLGLLVRGWADRPGSGEMKPKPYIHLCSNCGDELTDKNWVSKDNLFRHKDEYDCIKVLKNGYHRCIAELSQTRLELQAAIETIRVFTEKSK
jgi:hypothetical protein